jgi:hypothetical protein
VVKEGRNLPPMTWKIVSRPRVQASCHKSAHRESMPSSSAELMMSLEQRERDVLCDLAARTGSRESGACRFRGIIETRDPCPWTGYIGTDV